MQEVEGIEARCSAPTAAQERVEVGTERAPRQRRSLRGWKQPELFAFEVRAAFKSLRKSI